jgi:death on curing protein
MTDVKDVINIHNLLIGKFGGSKGIRDKGALESALFRPYATFDQKELYPSPIEKAAAILESLVNNHPFIDGNKRTAYVVTRLLLLSYGLDINATQEEKYNLVISVAKGEIKFDEIKNWLSQKLTPNK